jgi:hypothetical protein
MTPLARELMEAIPLSAFQIRPANASHYGAKGEFRFHMIDVTETTAVFEVAGLGTRRIALTGTDYRPAIKKFIQVYREAEEIDRRRRQWEGSSENEVKDRVKQLLSDAYAEAWSEVTSQNIAECNAERDSFLAALEVFHIINCKED